MLVKYQKISNQRQHRLAGEETAGYLLILPALVIYGIFVLYPVVDSAILSFYKWDGAGAKVFVSLANYIQAFKDRVVWISFKNNAIYTAGIIALGVFPGLILATLIAGKISGRTMFEAIFFFPRLLTQVIVAIVWSWIFNPVFGLLNEALRALGLGFLARGWLGEPRFALLAIIVAGAWTYFGFCMVIFLAALQNTDPTLYDAALIDGANAIQIFINVTLPQIKYVVAMVIVYTIIDSFKVFDLVYLLTQGGPGNATQIMATYIYRKSFAEYFFGYGSSVAILLTCFILAISVLYLRYQERGM
ncbi:MAG: carbohydrate ABC transporter permease [Candidatus Caldatribacteriaceae bacterium]